MKKRVAFFLLLFFAGGLVGRSEHNPQPKPLVFTHVTVIDATGAPAKPDMTVVITGDYITAIGKTGKVHVPKGAQVVNARGKFLIPGLWDMHVHLSNAGESSLPLLIANGVTSVRDMSGNFAEIQRWREKIAAGLLLGPRIKTAGPAMESARFLELIKRVDQLVGKPVSQVILPTRIGVANEEEAVEGVQSLAKMGVDFIKVRTQTSRETYLAIAAEAKRWGLPLVGHEPMVVSILEASEAGQKSIEHIPLLSLTDLSEAERHEVFTRLAKNGTWMVPTLVSAKAYRATPDSVVQAVIKDTGNTLEKRRKYISPALLDFWDMQIQIKKFESPMDWAKLIQQGVQDLRAMHRAGVRIMAGTDLAAPLIFPGFSLHDELKLLVNEGGLTPMEALQSATRSPAEFFGIHSSLGTVERGKIADLVLLEANPLKDISHTQKIYAVVLGGRFIPKSDLQEILARAEAIVTRHRPRLDPVIFP